MSTLFPHGLFPELDLYIKEIIYKEVSKLTSVLPLPDIEEDEIWSLQKASQVIGVSTQTLAKMILRGEIVAVKPGRKWKLTKNNVTLYMNRKLN
jgi:excisionase family DNA binding protein